MQDYTYSMFSSLAIIIHLIINFNLLSGRWRAMNVERFKSYRGYLLGVLFYYLTDAAWGIFAGLGWISPWYVDTVFFFLSLPLFVFLWARFVIVYLELGKWPTRMLNWSGWALLAFNIVLLTANNFNNCIFYFDDQGTYLLGNQRYLTFYFLVAFLLLLTVCVVVKVIGNRGSARRRGMIVFLFCITLALSIVLQVILPLTPFTALGCLVGNCFLHFFVIADERAEMHMNELEQALERARAAEKAKSFFFSSVSHDIRTPLNSIIGFAEMLQLGIDDPEEKERALDAIVTSSQTLLELINDVLDLSKLEAGKMEIHPVPTDVGSVVKRVAASFETATSRSSVQLLTEVEEMPYLELDPRRIRQILFNLIGNAVKFTLKGSITIRASFHDGTFTFSVADTGFGIAQENIDKLMSPYVQILEHDITKGSGLGLAICKQLVTRMNGTLELKSALGKGSTFTIRIPNVQTVSEEVTRAYLSEHEVSNHNMRLDEDIAGKHILIVDDQKLNQKILQAMLSRLGIQNVLTAQNGKDALDTLHESGKVDLVLTDMSMPVMDGAQLVREIRKEPAFDRIPVYVITADVEMTGRARDAGFDNMLLKPITLEKLKELLAGYSPRQQSDETANVSS